LSNPSVAIVILNYNGRNYLQRFLPGVLASAYDNKRVIVADNASTDDSIDLLKAEFPSVELILLEKNYGFAEGYNQALKQVESDYYVFLRLLHIQINAVRDKKEFLAGMQQYCCCFPLML